MGPDARWIAKLCSTATQKDIGPCEFCEVREIKGSISISKPLFFVVWASLRQLVGCKSDTGTLLRKGYGRCLRCEKVVGVERDQVVLCLLTDLLLARKSERMDKMKGASLGIACGAALFFGIENPRWGQTLIVLRKFVNREDVANVHWYPCLNIGQQPPSTNHDHARFVTVWAWALWVWHVSSKGVYFSGAPGQCNCTLILYFLGLGKHAIR